MQGFNVKWLVAGLVLLGVGFAGGYKMAPQPPSVTPDTTTKNRIAGPVAMEFGPGACVHFDGSEYWCPGLRPGETIEDMLFPRGDSIAIGPISVTWRDSTYILPMPAHVDAVFFTPEGAQILLEHYQATNRVKATKLQNLLRPPSRK